MEWGGGFGIEGRTALVTGASGGIGADIARELAQRGAALVLVARRLEELEKVAAHIRASADVVVRVRAVDLGDERARVNLSADLAGANIDILVNNAGFGLFGRFTEASWERTDAMLQLDVVALTHLTRLFIPDMLKRGWGRVLLLGSTGSFQPTPWYAVYAAAKAYVLSMGVALNYELRGTGVTCTTLCPGITATDFLRVSGQRATLFQRATLMTSADVARIGVRGLLAQRGSVVPGPGNAVTAFFTRFMPRGFTAAVAERLMRN
jgi:short-subunit dehydrogenase